MIAIRAEYVEALAILDLCHAEALARGLYAAACEDKRTRNYDQDRAIDRKWHAIAEALAEEFMACEVAA